MWQAALAQGMQAAATAAAGGPSSAQSRTQQTPNVGGEWNVNFSGQQYGTGRSIGGSGSDSGGLGGISPVLLIGAAVIGAALIFARRK